jgi:hypothetical protein
MPPARARKSEIAAAKRDLMQKLQPHFDELEQGVALLRGDVVAGSLAAHHGSGSPSSVISRSVGSSVIAERKRRERPSEVN